MKEVEILNLIKQEVKDRYNIEIEPKITDHLEDNLGLDSLDKIQLCIELEDALSVDFKSKDTSQIETVQDVVKLVEKYINE